jgi:hypothetical protein
MSTMICPRPAAETGSTVLRFVALYGTLLCKYGPLLTWPAGQRQKRRGLFAMARLLLFWFCRRLRPFISRACATTVTRNRTVGPTTLMEQARRRRRTTLRRWRLIQNESNERWRKKRAAWPPLQRLLGDTPLVKQVLVACRFPLLLFHAMLSCR